MKIMPPVHNIEWLIDSSEYAHTTTTIGVASETKKIQFPYPPEMATGFSEHTQTRDGIVLIQDTHNFIQGCCPPVIPLGNFTVQFPEPTLGIHTVHTGQVLITDCPSNEVRLRHAGIDGFSHSLGYSLEQTVKTTEPLTTTALQIPVTQLKKLVDDESIEMIFTQLDVLKVNSYGFHTLPASISKMLEHCIDHSFTDTLKALQLQARFLDYICGLSLYLCSDIVKTQNQHPAKARAHAVHNFLMSVGADTPTLSTLSEKFGASSNKLNAEFVVEYGESIFSFLTNYRLEQARLAIEKSSQPLKVIAHKIGYSHVNHFITAFKRRYNCTPGSLRVE